MENKNIDQKKFLSLLEDMDFIKKLILRENIPDVQKLFKSEGIDLSEDDVIVLGKIVNRTILKEDIINDEELSKIYGGAGRNASPRKISFLKRISESASASMGVIGGFNNGQRGWKIFSRKKREPVVLSGINKHAIARSIHEGSKDADVKEVRFGFID